MKILVLTVMVFFFGTNFCTAQQRDMKFDGSMPPQKEVLELMEQYVKAGTEWKTIQERDEKRQALVAKGYFYHGQDGIPIGFDGMNKRQIKNELKIDHTEYYDLILYQFENTAMVTYKSFGSGMDKGKPFESYESGILTMGKEGGTWKVLADIIGKQPNPRKLAPSQLKVTQAKSN